MIEVPTSIEEVLALPSVQLSARGNLPSDPGLYFVVVDREQVIYVGIARVSLLHRWRGHHKGLVFGASDGVVIHYLASREPERLRPAEVVAIDHWRPIYNGQPPYMISREVVNGKTIFTKLSIAEAWHRVLTSPPIPDADEIDFDDD